MKPESWGVRLPWLVVFCPTVLVVLGCIGIARCEDLSGGSGKFLRMQLVWAVLAVFIAAVAALPNYRKLGRWSFALYLFAAVLLVLVYFFPPVNGARRWVRIGSLSFQPSELAKVACVLAVARSLMNRPAWTGLAALVAPLGLTALPVLLVLREPDLGTAMVFIPTVAVMLVAAGLTRAQFLALALLGLLALPVLWSHMSLEQRSRVTSLFEQAGPGEAATGDGYHLRQAKMVLALGGFWGSLLAGPAVNDPGAYHLPEARSDFIFCVLKERLGLPGAALVLGLYGVIVWRGFEIAAATREPFGRLAAVGLTSLIAVQVLINTGMNVGLLPITGLSLPLVSYGGSGLVSQGLLLGLLINIGMRPGYALAREPFRPAGSSTPSRARFRSGRPRVFP